MLNIVILGGGPSINLYDRVKLDSFCRNAFTIAINDAYKHFPHDIIVAQDFTFIKREAERLQTDTSLKLLREWPICKTIYKKLKNCIIMDNDKCSRNLSGVLALELVVNWLAESRLKSKIYLFGYDHKPNGHFHNDLPIPESACGLREYEPFKAAPCVNMSPDSAIPFWPKMSKLPEIEPTTPDEKDIFFRQAKTWLLQKRFSKMGDL